MRDGDIDKLSAFLLIEGQCLFNSLFGLRLNPFAKEFSRDTDLHSLHVIHKSFLVIFFILRNGGGILCIIPGNRI